MAQQQHSSEIVVSIDDTHVARAVRSLTEQFTHLQQTAREAVQTAGQTARQTAQQIARTAHVATGGISTEIGAGVVYTARGVQAVGQGVRAGASALGDVAGTAIPFAGGLVRSLINARMARTGEASALEAIQAELAVGGGFSGAEIRGARRAGASLGMSPQESLNVMRQLSQTTGESADLGAMTRGQMRAVLEAQRVGIGAGALGAFAGGGAIGGGALSGYVGAELATALRVAQEGRRMGLSGAGVERYLGAIASATQGMASQGLRLDTASYAGLVQAVSESAMEAGNKTAMGAGAVRAVQRVTAMGGGALSAFRGQFGDIGQGALQALASQGAQSPLEMIANLEALASDPTRALEGLRQMGLSPEMQKLALAGAGASLGDVEALLGGLDRAQSMVGADSALLSGERLRGRMGLSVAQATRSNELVSMIESNKQASISMINLSADMEKLALSMTSNGAVLTQILSGLESTVSGALEPGGVFDQLTTGVNDLIAFLKRVTG